MPDPGERPERPEDLAALRAEIDAVERSMVREVDLGVGAVVIAGGVLLLLIAAMLPWVDGVTGWQLLLGLDAPATEIGLLPRLFAGTALGFGVLLSVAALLSRRWVLAWLCALGCWFSVVDGIWAIWSQQTVAGPGPGGGLVLAVVTVIMLAALWIRVAWSRL